MTTPHNEPPQTGNEKQNITGGLLNNFFHEVISRNVPGFVVLALYFHKQVIAAFKIFGDSSIIFGLTMLVATWLIGVTLDCVVIVFLLLWNHPEDYTIPFAASTRDGGWVAVDIIDHTNKIAFSYFGDY